MHISEDLKNKAVFITDVELRPTVFLDLDGTIRYSTSGDFIEHPDDIRLFAGVEEVLWKWKLAKHLIIGVTNQGGVAHGFKSPIDVDREITRTQELFEKDPFDLINVCYHHEDGRIYPYNTRSLLRKPDIGMLVLAETVCYENGYVIDWENSLMVGDRPEDQMCAANANIPFRWAWDFFGRSKP